MAIHGTFEMECIDFNQLKSLTDIVRRNTFKNRSFGNKSFHFGIVRKLPFCNNSSVLTMQTTCVITIKLSRLTSDCKIAVWPVGRIYDILTAASHPLWHLGAGRVM